MYLWLWFGTSVVKHPLQEWKVPGSIPSRAITFFHLNGGWVAPCTRVQFPDYKYICTTGRLWPFSHQGIACHSMQLLLVIIFIQPTRDGPIFTDTDFCIWITYRYRYWFSQKYRLTYTDYYDHRSVTTTYSHNVHPIHWCTNLWIYCQT